MKKTNIITIEANETHINGNAKAVYCWELDKVYPRMTDAAIDLGCSIDAVSNVIRGVQRTCKGMHFCLVADIPKYINEITQVRSRYIAKLRDKANKADLWDAYIAEQERIRKAEEKKAKELHEAEMAVLKYEKKCKAADGKITKYQAIRDKNSIKLVKAQEKLRMLKGDDAVC